MTQDIQKTIDLKAPIARVWRAITDPAEFGAWFRVKLDDSVFTPGKPARGHPTYAGYEHLDWQITVVAMDEPSLFSFTWHPYAVDPAVDYSSETPTLVEFRLSPKDGGTHLVITETGFENVPEHRRAEAVLRNGNGWATQIQNIAAHVDV